MQNARRQVCVYIFLIVAFGSLGEPVFSSGSSSTTSTKYSFEEFVDALDSSEAKIVIPQISFGSASFGKIKVRHKKGLVIQSIKTTCGCTSAKVSRTSESESLIFVEIRPSTPRDVSSQVKVEMQDGSVVKISITGKVISKVSVTPPVATIKDSIAIPLSFSSTLTDLSASTIMCLDDRFVFEVADRSSSKIEGVVRLAPSVEDQAVGLSELVTFVIKGADEDHRVSFQLRRLVPKRFIPSAQRVDVESPEAFSVVVFADKLTTLNWSGRFRIGELYKGSISRSTERSVIVDMTPQAAEFVDFGTESYFDVEVEIRQPTGVEWHSMGRIRLTPH